MSNVKIISNGTAKGTKIIVGDSLMDGVSKIEIEPLKCGGTVKAIFTVEMTALEMDIKDIDIKCSDILTANRIKTVILTKANECKET